MAGTLGSLVLKLSADAAQITADLGKVANSSQKYAETVSKQWEDAQSKITEGFKKVGEVVGVALSAEAIKEFVKSAIEAAETVDNLSKQLGVSTQAIQTYSFAAGLTGKSLDDVASANARLLVSAQKAAAGSAQQVEAFRAIGISGQQLTALLKDPEELFQTFAEHIASFGDGAGKTAVAIELLGRSGAGLIPYLDKLGSSFDEIKVQAIALGVVLSDVNQSKLTATGENLDLLSQAGKGLANELAISLAPAINAVTESLVNLASSEGTHSFFSSMGNDIAQAVVVTGQVIDEMGRWADSFNDLLGSEKKATGDMQSDLVGYIQSSLDEAGKLVNAFAHGWIDIKAGFVIMWDYVRNAFSEGVAELEKELSMLADAASLIAKATNNAGLGAQLDAYSASLKLASQNVSSFSSGLDGLAKEGDQADAQLKIWIDSNAQWANGIRVTSTAFDIFTTGLDTFQKSLKAGDIAGNLGKLNDAEQNISDTAKELIALGGDETKINADRDNIIKQLTKSVQNADKAHVNYNADLKAGTKYIDESADALLTLNAYVLKLQGDTGGPATKAWGDYAAGLIKLQQAAEEAAIKGADIDKVIADWNAGIAALGQTYSNSMDKIIAASDYLDKIDTKYQEELDSIKGVTEAQQVEKQYLEDLAVAQKAWDDKLSTHVELEQSEKDRIHDMAQAHVELINQTKLSVEAAKQWQSIWAQAGNGIADTFSKILVEGGSLFDGLKNLAKQTVEAIIAYFAKLAVINPILNQVFGQSSGYQMLPTLANSWAGSSFSGTTSGGLATSGLIQGGGSYVLADVGGGPSGAAGASATNGAMSALQTTAGYVAAATLIYTAGSAIATKLGGNGTIGGLFGGIIGALFSGGWKKTGVSTSTLTINPDGTIGISDTYQERKSGGIFGSSSTKDKSVAASQDQIDAANAIPAAIQKGLDAFAAKFGINNPQIVGGTYQVVTDKKGNQTITSNVNGQTYTGETEQQFAERLTADSFLAVLDKMGLGASEFVKGVQGNADDLLAAVQDFATATDEANSNLNKGFKFMALSADQTLPDVMKFVEGLEQGGETLTQAYERLASAQNQYNEFVAKFAPATKYIDPFEAALSGLYKQMTADIATANSLAKAAGATGASIQDLTNIQQYYANQVTALVGQLKNSAQELAFNLGLSAFGSLDEVNSEIAALQSKAGDGSSAVHNFGNAIANAAQKASDAMNLLLGDLSPLNDQQKLQDALQGLRAGTVTQEQVLEIGRRLYASSEAYTQLFNQVKQYGGHTGAGSNIGGIGGGSSGGLTDAEQKRLTELEAYRDKMQPIVDMQQYQNLAQQVAEISAATGEDVMDVLKDMGINDADFEKALGLKDDAALKTYIEGYEKLTDSAGDNTTSIVTAINNLPTAIAAAIAGQAVQTALLNRVSQGDVDYSGPGRTVQPGNLGPTPNTPPGTGNNGTQQPPTGGSASPGQTQGTVATMADVASAFASVQAPVIARIDSSNRRGLRWAQPA